MLLSNFSGEKECMLKSVCNRIGKPVFTTRTTIDASGSTATFSADVNHSVVNTLKFFINGTGMEAIQEKGDSTVIYLLNLIKGNNKLSVTAFDKGKTLTKDVKLSTKVLKVSIRDGELIVEDADAFPDDGTEASIRHQPSIHHQPSTLHHQPLHHYYDLQGRLIATCTDETQSPSGKLPRGIYVKDNKIIAGTTAR